MTIQVQGINLPTLNAETHDVEHGYGGPRYQGRIPCRIGHFQARARQLTPQAIGRTGVKYFCTGQIIYLHVTHNMEEIYAAREGYPLCKGKTRINGRGA